MKYLVLITIFEITVGNKILLEVNGHKGNLNFKFVHIIFYLKAFFIAKEDEVRNKTLQMLNGLKEYFDEQINDSQVASFQRLKSLLNNENKKGKCIIKLAVCILSLPKVTKKPKNIY
jgi:hypothetical protein